MATIPSNSIAALSQIKVSAMKPAAAKAAPPPPPPPKPEVLATNANGVVAGKGRVVIDIEAPDSGYSNIIYYSTDNFKTRQYVGIDNETGTVDVGTFKPGTTIQFGIDNGQGDLFRIGGKVANSDKVDHTKVSKLADGGVRVGFEDLRGGGDRDFNDAIIKVRSVPVEAATPTAPALPAIPNVPPSNDNRSGLGDGTNPGQGAGSANSPNQGTLNPGATPAAGSAATTGSTATTGNATTGGNGNRSGLGDGTNPGQGAGSANSPNQGTLNPGGLR
jgi:hypothetical protein